MREERREKREDRREKVRLRRQLPLHKGFASVRSTLAGLAETDSETAQRLECKKTIPHRLRRSSLYIRDLRVCEARLQASPRRVRKPRSGWRVVKRQSLSRLAPTAPFTQGICKYAEHACRPRREGFGNRAAVGGLQKNNPSVGLRRQLPLHKGALKLPDN